MVASVMHKIKHEVRAEMPIKCEAKLSALLAWRQHAECFVLYISRARPCFNCFKELTHERLLKLTHFNDYPSVNFFISGMTILDDILCKCFSM